jgi:hypothetical protein
MLIIVEPYRSLARLRLNGGRASSRTTSKPRPMLWCCGSLDVRSRVSGCSAADCRFCRRFRQRNNEHARSLDDSRIRTGRSATPCRSRFSKGAASEGRSRSITTSNSLAAWSFSAWSNTAQALVSQPLQLTCPGDRHDLCPAQCAPPEDSTDSCRRIAQLEDRIHGISCGIPAGRVRRVEDVRSSPELPSDCPLTCVSAEVL